VPIRTLQNLARHPNFGGEAMIVGLGCEKLEASRIAPERDRHACGGCGGCSGSPVLLLQEESLHGFGDMMAILMRMAEERLDRLDRRRREPCPLSGLVVGAQCGGSDAFSGVTANPAVGFASDLLVRAGATVMFSEVTEVRDAIHLLVPRAADGSGGRALLREMDWYDRYLAAGGADRSANTTPGNKRGGLANIMEKALGSIAKSGSGPIVDVIGPGERVRKQGLVFAATPASDFLCGPLQLAAGMNLQLFTTGRGTPYGLQMAPVLKVSSSRALSDRWSDLVDVDASRISAGEATIEEVGWEIFRLVLDVASGRKKAAADRLGLYNDLILFNPGPVT
jgi:galactarate dehydratase